MQQTDTIAAIITAPGQAAVSIIRLSGLDAMAIADSIYEGKQSLKDVASHTVHYGWIRDDEQGILLDEVLMLVMHGPATYTGEDVVEIQCHGGYTAVSELLRLVLKKGARLAETGEFSRRAFLNGKMDLTQAEAVMDLVEAQSNQALSLAAQQKKGRLEEAIQALRDETVTLIAFIQADLDYPEDDIERLSDEEFLTRVGKLQEQVDQLLLSAQQGRLYKEGLHVVIAGLPNVGKSSLLNALLGRERAIVTNIPGTTRDIVQEHITLQGVPILLTDTAGLRETSDLVEQIGVDRAKDALGEADFVLYVFDGSQGEQAADLTILKEIPEEKVLYLYNKQDLPKAKQELREPHVVISAKTGEGLGELSDKLFSLATKDVAKSQTGLMVSNTRHIALLEQVRDYYRQFQASMQSGFSEDLLVIDLQSAWETLGLITGDTADDNLIDEIFSRFCLGK